MPLILPLTKKSDCASKPLALISPLLRNKPLTDSPDRNSNPFQTGTHGRKERMNNSTNSTNKMRLETPLILQFLTLMQSSLAQHGSVRSKEMEPVNPEFAVMEARKWPPFFVQLHPVGHPVSKCPCSNCFLHGPLLKAVKFVVLMFKMRMLMPRRLMSKPTCKLTMCTLNGLEKFSPRSTPTEWQTVDENDR